jgi:hypothetical protein
LPNKLRGEKAKGQRAAASAPDADHRLWPFRTRDALAVAAVALLILLGLMAVLKIAAHWPGDNAETTLLLAVMAASFVPIVLAAADIVIRRGGAVEYAGFKVDFSKGGGGRDIGFSIPPNIGVRDKPLYDSDTAEILATLRDATRSKVAIIDLEQGEAWWETRLLVLLAGADRLGAPERIVFIATDKGQDRQFLGWATARGLLQRLIKAEPKYALHVAASRAAAAQWKTVEPPPPPPALPGLQFAAVTGGLASKYAWMAFDVATTLPNDLLAEQILQSELGLLFEAQGAGHPISVSRLEALFRLVLRPGAIELSASSRDQVDALLSGQEADVVLTQGGAYLAMTPKVTLLGELVRSLLATP